MSGVKMKSAQELQRLMAVKVMPIALRAQGQVIDKPLGTPRLAESQLRGFLLPFRGANFSTQPRQAGGRSAAGLPALISLQEYSMENENIHQWGGIGMPCESLSIGPCSLDRG
jgi:hypothetical protein